MRRRVTLCYMLAALTGCASFGSRVDDRVVAGKLTAEGAVLLNKDDDELLWKRHSDFGRPLEAGDRIIARELSECLKAITQGGDNPEECYTLLKEREDGSVQ